jgi:ribosomal protein S18 acetylase RimI-like enzyme
MIHIVKAIELDDVDRLSLKAIRQMNLDGLTQWDERYPRAVHFLQDIRHASLYGCYIDETLVGVACIDQTFHSCYSTLPWELEDSLIVHRMVVDPARQGQGIGRMLLEHAEGLATRSNKRFVKLDTHQDNNKMIGLLVKMGYREVGYLQEIHRIAYEKEL